MKLFPSGLLLKSGYPIITVLVILLVAFSGCMQQSADQTVTQSGIKVSQPDNSHIIVAYVGDQGVDGLLEMEVTVSDSTGKTITLSKGSRLGQTPLPIRSTISFSGPFTATDHVHVTGYFTNQSNVTLVDTGI